jgi:L-aminopeptidase/D-esterase-like protein
MSITEIAGVRVGHWTDTAACTGCTVVLFPDGTVASGEVRGGAPATREWELLAPERLVARIDAVVLTGGSAFGLAACDGVMRFCEGRGMGFPTAAGAVPIVVGAGLFDLLEGDGSVRPTAADGYAACVAAGTMPVPGGRVGAGAGATVNKWRGRDHARPGGIGSGLARHGDVSVGALLAVNAFGDGLPAGSRPALDELGTAEDGPFDEAPGANTTIGVVVTNASLDKVGCLLVARAGHDGLARALWPVHTTVDGDALVAASVGGAESAVDVVAALANEAVALAVENALSGA